MKNVPFYFKAIFYKIHEDTEAPASLRSDMRHLF